MQVWVQQQRNMPRHSYRFTVTSGLQLLSLFHVSNLGTSLSRYLKTENTWLLSPLCVWLISFSQKAKVKTASGGVSCSSFSAKFTTDKGAVTTAKSTLTLLAAASSFFFASARVASCFCHGGKNYKQLWRFWMLAWRYQCKPLFFFLKKSFAKSTT